MEFTVWMDTDNEAAAQEGAKDFVRKNLSDIGQLIKAGLTQSAIRDDDGNIIGRWALTVESKKG